MEFGFWQALVTYVAAAVLFWRLLEALDELKTISRRLMSLEARLEEVAERSQMVAGGLDDLKSEVAGVRKEVEELNWQPPPRV
jgi:hypothetical protein